MSKFKLKIESNCGLFTRLLKGLSKILSHIFSTFLILAAIFFVFEKLVPIIKDGKELKRSIQQKHREFQEQQKKLLQIKLEGPFTRQWRPKHYQQYVGLCFSDTLAYKKLTLLKKNTNVIIQDLKVKKEKEKTIGFDFSIEILGTYSEIVEYLTHFENQFSFFQIKSMNLSPEPAEKRYMGLLRFHLEGWLW